jgi:cell division protein ZapA
MSTVTLTIGPKNYVIACADGEEAQIAALGAVVAEKYAQLGTSRAPLEAQNILFAALFIADELAEARRQIAAVSPARIADLEQQVKQLQLVEKAAQDEIARLSTELSKARTAKEQDDLFNAQSAAEAPAMVAEQLEELASRAEALANSLEAARPSA